jgi:UDP-glucuronate decarboxylase
MSRNPEQFFVQYPEFSGLSWLSFHKGDILQPNSFPKMGNFTHLLHAATDSTLGPFLTPLDRYTQIVDGTRYMLDYAVENGIKRFLLTSSGGVYGPQPEFVERIPETYTGMADPLNAQNAYSVAKRAAEHLCALYRDRYGLEPVIARCFAFVGQDLPLDVHFAVGNFIRDALLHNEITVSGDGTAVRSFLDQRDLAEWLLTLLEKGKSCRAYNVGSDQAISIAELACLVRDTLAPRKQVRILGKAEFKGVRSRYLPDITRAQTELGLKVNISLADALLTTAKAASK